MAEDFGPSAVSENNQERNSSANGCNFIFPQIQARPAVYHHVKKLMFTVRVDEPDPRFGNMLLEQFGGANGELAAAMQYSIQGLNCDDPQSAAKDYQSGKCRPPEGGFREPPRRD